MAIFSDDSFSSRCTVQIKPILRLENGIKIDFTEATDEVGCLDITHWDSIIRKAGNLLSMVKTNNRGIK